MKVKGRESLENQVSRETGQGLKARERETAWKDMRNVRERVLTGKQKAQARKKNHLPLLSGQRLENKLGFLRSLRPSQGF